MLTATRSSNIERIIGSNYDDSITVAYDTAAAIKYEVVAGYGADSLTVDFGTAASAADVVLDIDFDGGFGVDTLILAGELNLADVTNRLAIDLGIDAVQAGAVSLTGVENIDLTGFTSNADVVGVTGSDVANMLTLGDLKSVRVSMLAGNDIVKIGDAVKGITGLDGGLGSDTLDFSDRAAGVTLDLAAGTLVGKEADSTLVGAAGSISGFESVMGSEQADTIRGGDGHETIYGGAGDDILQGGVGYDVLDGGEGVDTVSYEGETAGVTIALAGAGYAYFLRSDGSDYDYILNVENIIGSEGNDALYGDSGANRLEGGGGNDYLVGGAGDDIIEGGADDDTLIGGAGDDTLRGGAGDDTIVFSASFDTTPAGLDDDVADGEDGEGDIADFSGAYFLKSNVYYGIKVDLEDAAGTNVAEVRLNDAGIGADKVASLDNIENVYGTSLADVIAGSSVANTLVGNGGNDDIYSGGGRGNSLIGGLGADNYFIAKDSSSTISDGAGLSTINFEDVGTFSELVAGNSGVRNLLALLEDGVGVSYENPAGTYDLELTISLGTG